MGSTLLCINAIVVIILICTSVSEATRYCESDYRELGGCNQDHCNTTQRHRCKVTCNDCKYDCREPDNELCGQTGPLNYSCDSYQMKKNCKYHCKMCTGPQPKHDPLAKLAGNKGNLQRGNSNRRPSYRNGNRPTRNRNGNRQPRKRYGNRQPRKRYGNRQSRKRNGNRQSRKRNRQPGSIKAECLSAHNELRAKHQDTLPLKWSNDLQKKAQRWAESLIKKNVMAHERVKDEGENIYWSSGNRTCEDAVKFWYDEIKYFNYTTGKSSGDTGHFTQVVWKASKFVGVGIDYKKDVGTFIVAKYTPPGNYFNGPNSWKLNVKPLN